MVPNHRSRQIAPIVRDRAVELKLFLDNCSENRVTALLANGFEIERDRERECIGNLPKICPAHSRRGNALTAGSKKIADDDHDVPVANKDRAVELVKSGNFSRISLLSPAH